MSNKNIWCVVPFSRPENIHNIKKQFDSQNINNKKIIIVENGKALGTCQKESIIPDVLLSSRPHQSHAKNTALMYLKENYPNDWWTTWDDDDWYGPNYLQELSFNLDKGDIIGKSKQFIKLGDGNLYLIDKWQENEKAILIHGPTITARVDKSPMFQVLDFGEDMDWLKTCRYHEQEIYATSRYNWCYMRTSNTESHAWNVSDDEIFFNHRGEMKILGPFDTRIIEGKIKVEGEIVPNKEFDLKKSSTYRILSEKGFKEEDFDRIIEEMEKNEKKTTNS